MDDHTWHELCEQASTEQDSTQLMELAEEIVALLDEALRRRPETRAAQGNDIRIARTANW